MYREAASSMMVKCDDWRKRKRRGREEKRRERARGREEQDSWQWSYEDECTRMNELSG